MTNTPTVLALVPCLGVIFKRGAWVLIGAGYSASLEARPSRTLRQACFYVALGATVRGPSWERVSGIDADSESIHSFQEMPPVSGAGMAETWFDIRNLEIRGPGLWKIVLFYEDRPIARAPFLVTA